MPIKWSAIEVSQAMDAVEHQLNLAEVFLDDAKARAREAKNIANLPDYMHGRLVQLITDIERLDYAKRAVDSVRKAIPKGAIEIERDIQKQGIQQNLGL